MGVEEMKNGYLCACMFTICMTYECGIGRSFYNNCNKVDNES